MSHFFLRQFSLNRAIFVGIFALFFGTLFAQVPIKTDNISITTPTMGQRFTTNKINIVGTLSPEVGDFLINNQLVTVKPDGSFSHLTTLAIEGENQLTLQIFNKKRLFLQPVLLEELSVYVTYLPSPIGITPTLTLQSPENFSITKKNEILFKGESKNAVKITIDGDSVDLDSTGKFYEKKTMTAVDTPQVFVVEATSKDNVKVSEKRTITYSPDRLAKAEITLSSPEQNAVITESQTTFKGSVKNGESLSINDVAVPLEKNGTFTYKAPLTKKNQYQDFTLIALSKDNQKTILVRRIYFTDPKTVPKKETTPTPAKIISATPPVKKTVPTKPEPAAKKEIIPTQALPAITANIAVIEAATEISDDVLVQLLPDIPKTLPVHISEDVKNKLNKKITLELEGADLRDVLKIISKKSGLNIVSDNSISGSVNIILYDTTIKDAIDYLLNTQGLAYRIVDNTVLIASDRKLDVPTQLDTAIIKLNNAEVESVTAIIKTYLAKGEFVQFSKSNNLIILYAASQKLHQLTAIIQGIDEQEEPQVFLEVQVIETSTAALKSRGIAWPSSIGVGVQANITNAGTTIQSNPSFQALIQLLESEGKAKILARPRLKAVNNDQAEIFIGERIPITQTTVDTTGRVAENVSFVDTGILLRVLPSINPTTREIKLKIQPEVSIISGFRGPNNDKPVIRSRKVNTSVWVKDGETVVIGGLFNSTDTKDISKVPLLGNVPLIGNLFSSSRKDNTQTELLITVTPKIVGRAQSFFETPETPSKAAD